MEKPEMMQENLTRPWHERIDPVTKLLLIAVLTLLSFVLTNIFAEAALIVSITNIIASIIRLISICIIYVIMLISSPVVI